MPVYFEKPFKFPRYDDYMPKDNPEGNKAVPTDQPLFVPTFNKIWDGPDAENFVQKNLLMLKYTSSSTLLLTLSEVALFNRTGVVEVGKSALRWGVPIMGAGAAYLVTLNTIATLRKKEAQSNHFYAGNVAGIFVGYTQRCYFSAIYWGLGLGLMGWLYKKSKNEGWEITQTKWPAKEVGWAWSHKTDWRIFDHQYPKGWVRELPKEDN